MKKFLYLFILLFTPMNISAIRVGEWREHLGYHNAQQVAVANNIIYVLTSTTKTDYNNYSLYSYDTEDTSVRTYSKVNILNDRNVVYITYSEAHKTLLVLYDNSNIDLIINDKDIYNISDFKNKIMMEDKTLNNIYLNGDYAYLCTNFGIVILNISKKEITTSYVLNKKVNNCILVDNYIVAATDEGIYKGDINDNLLDTSKWNKISSEILANILYFDNTIIGYRQGGGIHKYSLNGERIATVLSESPSITSLSGEKLIAATNSILYIYDNLNDSPVKINHTNSFKDISYHKNSNTFWCGEGLKGLNSYKINGNSLKITTSNIIPESPERSLSHFLNFTNNRLLIAGGKLSATTYPGCIFIYNEDEDNWINFEKGIEKVISNRTIPYRNINSVVEDPLDPNHHFASSFQGVYEFREGKCVNVYSLDNSTLETIYPDRDEYTQYYYVWTDGLIYDEYNNLWVFNEHINNVVHVLTKEGNWKKFHYKELEEQYQIQKPIFDVRGWLWAAGTRSDPGLFCLNTNNNLEDERYHDYKFITNFTDSEGASISLNHVYCITEDKNGSLWIGTDKGPLILNNPSNIFNSENKFYFTQIKVPRNDGTNLADLLLEHENILDIKIDGANRKWIATESSGVYLLSEDGLETIQHFTTDNSPLFSNNVTSLAINPKTGVVYMGTEGGLISYRSDATEAEDSFSEEAYAFPNPVYPDYEGVITVTGMMRDSDVKIVDTAGNLIYSGTSLGGQFTWNGKNRVGKRVASGVYFVIATTSEGKEGIITKILMIK